MANSTATKQTQNMVLRLAETGILLALSIILFEAIPVLKLPFGGSVTLCAQLPLVILGYRYGVKWGLVSGFTLSVIELIFGLENFSYVQGIKAYIILLFVDYLIAFTVLGLGGMFRNKIKNQALSIACGAFVVSCIRYLCHFISGVTIWADYANGAKEVFTYSLSYNGSYMIPEIILTTIGAFLIGSILNLKTTKVTVLKRNAK